MTTAEPDPRAQQREVPGRGGIRLRSGRAWAAIAGLVTLVSLGLGTISGVTGANWADDVFAQGTYQAGLAYGSFIDTHTQTRTTAFTSAPMTFSKGDDFFGITPRAADGGECGLSPNDCTKLCVDQDGYYDIQFSSQFVEEANADVRVEIWLWRAPASTPFAPPTTKDPNNVPWSGSEGLVSKGFKRNVLAWNFLEPAAAGECFALLWAIDTNTTITMAAEDTLGPGVLRPEVPSLILTIEQVG